MEYQLYKLIHIIGVMLFLGNIITGLFWMHFAMKTNDEKIIGFTIRGIILADTIFTTPAVIIITATGIMTAIIGHYPIFGTGWILWPIVMFVLSGAAFIAKVAPLQKKMGVMTAEVLSAGDIDWVKFRSLYRSWELWGLIATVTPIAAAAMMILKVPQ